MLILLGSEELGDDIFDALWSCDRVAVLGKSISKDQVLLISKWCTEEIIIMLDGTAHKEAGRMAQMIAQHWQGKVSIAHLPSGVDPDLLDREGVGCAEFLKKRSRVV